MDLQIACQWLAPRLDQVDAVFITQQDRSFAYAPTLVFLNHDPARWFTEPGSRVYSEGPRFAHSDFCQRFGKIHFMFPQDYMQARLAEITADDKPHRIIFIARPGEMRSAPAPSLEIRDPAGQPALLIYDVLM